MSDEPKEPLPDAEEQLPPEPEVTGGSGSQRAATPEDQEQLARSAVEILPPGGVGLQAASLPAVIRTLRRSLGQQTTAWIEFAVGTIDIDRREARRELVAARNTIDQLKESLHATQTDNALLCDREANARDQQIMKNLLTSTGGVLAGIAYGANHEGWTALSVGVMILGWVWPWKRKG